MSILTLHHSTAAPAFVVMAAAVVEESGLSVKEAAVVHDRREQLIDEELAQSFPASDPPSWVQGTSPKPT